MDPIPHIAASSDRGIMKTLTKKFDLRRVDQPGLVARRQTVHLHQTGNGILELSLHIQKTDDQVRRSVV